MKHFLMCEPKFFEVCYVINPWMEGNLGKVNHELAQRQWQNLYDIISGLAKVSLIYPVAGLPDMVFTANAGLVHKRVDGEKEIIVSSFLHAERKAEAQHYQRYFSSRAYRVKHLRPGTIFEGAGDALFDSEGRLWLGSGFRSDSHALGEINDALQLDAHALELVDPHWYHLDTAFCPLPQAHALAYKAAFSAKSAQALGDAFGENLIWVSDADAKNFACNAICIERQVILHKASAELKSVLLQRGFDVIEADVSEFIKAGGACKCLTLEI